MNTHYEIQMIYYRIAHLKPILLTNVTPIKLWKCDVWPQSQKLTSTSFSKSVQLCWPGHGNSGPEQQHLALAGRPPTPECGFWAGFTSHRICLSGKHTADEARSPRSESVRGSELQFSCCEMEGLDKDSPRCPLPLTSVVLEDQHFWVEKEREVWEQG